MLGYVHDLNPVLWDIVGPLKVRWYGLAYMMAFLVGYALMKRMSRRGQWVVAESQIGDFMAMLAIFGVFLGGRLGYVLLYLLPSKGLQVLWEDPLMLLKVWQGGMASHGGILGVALCALYFARKQGLSWLAVGDGICVVAPLGLFFGRCANFINGELYGRESPGLPWGMQFPMSLSNETADVQWRIAQACDDLGELGQWAMTSSESFATAVRQSAEIHGIAQKYLSVRHPSQLYEAALEGLLLFVIVWVARQKILVSRAGAVSGVFFMCYALFRIAVEQFREPDSSLVMGIMTKGQFFSLFMVIAGIAMLWHAYRLPQEKSSKSA